MTRRLSIRWPDPAARGAGLALTALVAALFADLLFRNHVLYERDLHQMLYGQVTTFVRCLAAGSWPVWDPYVGFGQPLLANPAAQILYPWTWLSIVVSPETCYTIYAAGHLLLSGIGLYALSRHLEVSPAGSLLAAALWMTSGPLLSLVSLWHHFGGAAWMPWVLLAADRALASPRRGRTLLWGAAMAGQILAGSADMCLLTGLLVAAWTLRYLRWRTLRDPAGRRWLGSCLGALAFALALSAGQWIPALELVRASARAELAEGLRMFWSLHPLNLIQVLVPILPQDLPLQPAYRALLFESREPLINSVYLGLASFPLVVSSFSRRSRNLALFFAAAGLGAALLALGRYGIAYDLAAVVFPPLRSLRYPAKMIILAALAWAALAGLGFDAWQGRENQRRPRVLLLLLPAAGVTAFALAVALALRLRAETWASDLLVPDPSGRSLQEILGPLAQTLTLTGLLSATGLLLLVMASRRRGETATPLIRGAAVLAVADLFLVHHGLNPTAPRDLFSRRPPILTEVPADGQTRVYVFDYFLRILGKRYRRPEIAVPVSTNVPDVPAPLRAALARQSFLSPPAGERWGLFGSYDHDWLSLYPKPLRNLSLFFRAAEETPGWLRLLRIGSVSYVVALHTEGLEDLSPLGTVKSPYAGTVYVFRVPDPLPRAYVVEGVRSADGLAALRALVEPQFDPGREIVLSPGPARTPSPRFSGAARLLSFLPDRIRVEAELSEPGYLVLLEAYDPGWHATVDGRDAPILRANMAFRAVPVPAGSHHLEFSYRPRSVILGLLISMASGFAALVLTVGRSSPSGEGRPS